MIKRLKCKFLIVISLLLILPFNFLVSITNYGAQKTSDFFHRQALEGVTADDFDFIRPQAGQNFEQLTQSFGPIYEINLNTYPISMTSLSGHPLPANSEEIISNADNYITNDNDVYDEIQSIGGFEDFVFSYDKKNNVIILRDISEFADQKAVEAFNTLTPIVMVVGSIFLFFTALLITHLITKPVEQAFKRQRQFINDASHELKTPLSIISLNLDLINEESRTTTEFNYIRQEVKRMDKLIKNLLSSSKADEFNKKLSLNQADVSSALLEVSLPFESLAYEKGIKMILNIEEDIMHKVDIESLKQVFIILIDNAMKYTPTNNTIIISLCKNRKMQFKIFNSGITISNEDQKLIFERFYRVDSSRLNNGSYGLGLSIAKDIISAHKGTITVNSSNEGTTFTIKL